MKKPLGTRMDEVRVRLETLEWSLPTHVDAMTASPISKLPFFCFIATPSWRCAELGRSVFDNLCEDKLVSGIVLTRATVETSAALWFLCGKVEEAALKSQTVGDIDEHLMKLVVGIATDAPQTNPTGDAFPRPVKVGAFLKLVEKCSGSAGNGTHEEATEALHAGRESCHPEEASAGASADLGAV